MMESKFDVIVVGGGHAGIEAALACSRLGVSVLLVTNNLERIGYMSCNPSIGGLAKGHMVREMDILGGEMGMTADKTCIQFKRLNSKKGPAVRGSRTQCDKDLYCQSMFDRVFAQKNLTVLQAEVTRLFLQGKSANGVYLTDGSLIRSQAVIITTGTFMNAVMHIGDQKISGGRVGDKATGGISDQLENFDFKVTRLKTGTPPRLYRDSIDWSKTTPQSGDKVFYPFSLNSSNKLALPQIDCYLTHTNEQTHDIIRENLNKSPMYSGAISGHGPRYCPSIEDKITRFSDKANHLTFLEPEGLNSQSIYLQGVSTSLPEAVQYQFLRTIPGLGQVKMIRPGYAVEYDFIEPTQITHTLETKALDNLFLAGQINGSSGYEEAGAQGMMAGINAALKIQNKNEFILHRHNAYIGVLIDDLVLKGTKEPYRMMTSRAEHRLVLREDNVIERLYELAKNFCLLSDSHIKKLETILTQRSHFSKLLAQTKINPTEKNRKIFVALNTPTPQKQINLETFLRRTEISSPDLTHFGVDVPERNIFEPVEINIKYKGYIKLEEEKINQTKKLEMLSIPSDLNYELLAGLSTEEVEKLSLIKPRTLGQISRISGVNPSAVHAIMIYLKAKKKRPIKYDTSKR